MGICSSADVVRVCVSPEPHPPRTGLAERGIVHSLEWRERERREVGMIEWAAWRRKGDGERGMGEGKCCLAGVMLFG